MVVKIHLWLGQGLIRTPGSTAAFVTEGGDQRDTWYSTNGSVLVWDHFNTRLGNGVDPFYKLELSNVWYQGGDDPDRGTWGPDLTFLQELRDDDPAAVHCFIKLSGAGVLRAPGAATAPHRWDKAGADLYPQIVSAVAGAVAGIDAILPGQTIELGHVLACFGYIEASSQLIEPSLSANLAADLEQFIADLRADLGAEVGGAATAPFLLYRTHIGTRQTNGGGYPDAGVENVRNAVEQCASKLDSCFVVNVDDTALRSDRIFSTADGTRDVGRAVWRTFLGATEPDALPSADGGIPVVIYLGQSNVVGQRPRIMLGSAFIGDPNLQNYDGSGLPIPWDDVWTYDHANEAVVPYDPSANDNTHPNTTWSNSEAFGPSASMVAELRKIHTNGLVLFKLGVGSSSIGLNTFDNPVWAKALQGQTYATGALAGTGKGVWPHLERGWRTARRKIIEATGRVPDVRLIVWHQGESDTEASLADQYGTNLRQMIADIRSLVSTDTEDGAVVPVGIVRTRKVPDGPFDIDGTDTVRAAQEAVAAEPGNFLIDGDAWHYFTDKVHLSAEGTLRAGRDIVASLPESYLAGCEPSGGA